MARRVVICAARRSAWAARAGVLAAATLWAAAVPAQPLRIQPGDTLAIYVNGALSFDLPQMVGPDGAAPVAYAGHVPLQGLTVEEAADFIRDTLVSRGLFTEPDVLVAVTEHRPIYVSGLVETPGAYPYGDTLTVAKAITLAGGPRTFDQADGVSPVAVFQYHLAVAELETGRRVLARDLVTLQRVEAQRAGAAAFEPAEPDIDNIDAAALAAAHEEERETFRLMENERVEQRALLEATIALLEAERETVTARSQELSALVDVLTVEVENSQDLVSRGLRRQDALITSRRNLSDARVDFLEMARAKTVTEQRLVEARAELEALERDRTLALSQEYERLTRAVAETREMNAARRRQIALFPGLLAAAAGGDSEVGAALRYVVERRTDGEITREPVDDRFVLQPGDLLMVSAATLDN